MAEVRIAQKTTLAEQQVQISDNRGSGYNIKYLAKTDMRLWLCIA